MCLGVAFGSATCCENQLYADNLECCAECPNALFDAARFTAQCVRSVGQDVSPGKCVLLGTSKAVRRAMKLWDISGDGWKIRLDVRDLGGHLDFTNRARAGTRPVGCGLRRTALLLLLTSGVSTQIGISVRCKCIPAGIHAVEASYVSSSSLGAFRAAIVRAVWSINMPLANTPAVLGFLDCCKTSGCRYDSYQHLSRSSSM